MRAITVLHAAASAERSMCDAVRTGETSAYEMLWSLHRGAARRYAISLTNTFDADDLVSEAFLKVFAALGAGRGPTGAFRPYLLTTVRHLAASWARGMRETPSDELDAMVDPQRTEDVVLRGLDNGLLRKAFLGLPTPWQSVLWLTIVDGYPAAEAGTLLSLTPNATAVLAYRAREGLRQAWLQAHVQVEPSLGMHRWALERAGRGRRGALSTRTQNRFDDHLEECRVCAGRVRDAVTDSTGSWAQATSIASGF